MSKSKIINSVIVILSVLIPLAVAFLLFADFKSGLGDWVKVLPGLNAVLNSTTSLLLIGALIAVKQGRIDIHRLLMTIAFFMGAMFLVSYILYHSSVSSVVYGDIDGDGILSEVERASIGGWRTTYLLILLSHIVLSVVVVPLVLMAFYYALSDQVGRHKRIVKFTWPIWFYVSVSGVLVYLMISPFYQ